MHRKTSVHDDSNSIRKVTAKFLGTNDYILASWSAQDNLSVNHLACLFSSKYSFSELCQYYVIVYVIYM